MSGGQYWWRDAHIYELYIDAFAGTIPRLIERLGYFTELGIDCLHILPHFPSPMMDGGYDVTDYRGVRADLGTIDDFRRLVAEAHARDIRIIIDFVLNHTSAKHPWFLSASQSVSSPWRDFYLWSKDPNSLKGAHNAFLDIKSSNWIPNPPTGDYYFATFYPAQPDLNWDNPAVVDAMFGAMDSWIELGVDGFRLDAARHLIKRANTSSEGLPETHLVLKALRAHLDREHPNVVLLAETAQSIQDTLAYFGAGDKCHMVYHFPLMEALWMALAFGDMARVERVLQESFTSIPESCQWGTFLRNHDEISLRTLSDEDRVRLVNTIDPLHRYPFNKGTTASLRLATALHGDRRKIIEAFELLYSLPGAPIMYYGDEIGMENLPVQEGIVDTRMYVRGAFDWEDAVRQMRDPDSLWSAVRGIIRRRRETRAV